MSDNPQSHQDPLEEVISAFQAMTVCERPPDAEVLARYGIRQGNVSRRSGIPMSSKRRYLVYLVVSSTAAAVLVFGGLAIFLRNSPPPESTQVAASPLESTQVAATAPPGKGQDVAAQPRPKSGGLQREGLGSFGQHVADAQVIVVATALDSAPAPPKRPGDLPEVSIRFQVKRVLKGELAVKEITTRTPTAADEFIGKDWVILLSPGYMAGQYPYASHINIKLEPTVKSYLTKGNK
jgi:hypothetical protein